MATDPNLNVTGWGIHIEEGLNEVSVAFISVVILLVSGIVGLSYALALGDTSGGFGIASWITGVLGTLITALYFMWQQA